MRGLLLVMPFIAVYASKGMTLLLGVGACAVLLDPSARKAVVKGSLRWPVLTFAPLLLYALATAPWAVNSAYTVLMTARVLGVLAAALILWRTIDALDESMLRNLQRYALVGGLLLLCLVGAELSTDLAFMSWLKNLERAPGKNDYVTYINSGVSLLALFSPQIALITHERLGKVTALSFLLVAALILHLGYASTPVLGFVLAIALILAVILFEGRALKLFGIAAIVGVLAMPFAFENYLVRRGGLQGLEHSIGWSSLHRLHIWSFALERWHEKPLIGWGLDASRDVPGGRTPVPGFVGVEYMPLHPHNGALQSWLELGFVGTLAFVFVLWRLARGVAGQTNHKAMMAGAALMGGYAAQGMLSFGLWQNWWLASLALGALMMLLMRGPKATVSDALAEWQVEDFGKSRRLTVNGSSHETPYSKGVIEQIVARKGALRAVKYLTLNRSRIAYVKPLSEWLTRQGGVGLRILEVGCEAGHITEYLNAQSFVGEIFAYDVDKAFVDVVELKRYDLKLGKVARIDHLTSEQTLDLPYPDASFDVIIVLAVVEHLPFENRHRHVDAIWRKLKPGGIIAFLDTPNRWYPFETHSVGIPLIARLSPEPAFLYARVMGRLKGVSFAEFMRPGTGWRNASYSECLPKGRMVVAEDISREAGYGFPFFLRHTAGRWRKGLKLIFWGPLAWTCTRLGIPFEFFAPNLQLVFRKGTDYEGA
ncbi:MAG: methyltransferase domain-containing protein [Alphaproteobacteria bacterium]|nr:methyltransferase domain-containing protein [Alphaproteobacteria bacterium]